MNKRIFGLIVTGSALCLLSACNTVRIQSWSDPQFDGRSIGKTIVLGVAESDSLSRQYEDLFVSRLLELGVEAGSLHANTQITHKIGKDALDALLKSNNVDTIIVTRTRSETERNQVVTTGYYATPYNNYWGYYDYGYSLSYNTAHVASFMEFELETNVYDVETEKLVWTGRKVVYDDRSDLTNMKGIIKGVIKDLSKKGMID
ncbi:MAG: hypothetical protein V3V05_08405 [Pontiella sp.]